MEYTVQIIVCIIILKCYIKYFNIIQEHNVQYKTKKLHHLLWKYLNQGW